MKIVITESQYNTLLNEMGSHNPKELRNLIKWIENHTTCDVELKNNNYRIVPPQELYKGIYIAHNTEGAVSAIVNFIKNVYGKTSNDVSTAWKADKDLV